MKRTLRRMLKACWLLAVILSTVLLILAAALSVESFTGGLWVMHYDTHVNTPSIQTERWMIDITSTRGRFHIQAHAIPERWADHAGHAELKHRVRLYSRYAPSWLFNIYTGASGRWYWHVWGTYLPIAILSAILPSLWWLGWLRRRRLHRLMAQGRCLQCGYDLRASPERCPECGATVETEVETETGTKAVTPGSV